MEAASHSHDHHHHELPTSGRALTSVAVSATLHCLTGCAIGEVLGMIIGTALGFSEWGTVALAVGLAFLFGYALTSLPLLRSGLALAAVVPIAFASDTLSIATMEIVDNAIMLAIPGAMEAGVGNVLFWGALAFALAVAGVIAMPVNRWLIARGKGHAVIHETGVHGGLPPRVVGIAAAVAFAFGSVVLVAEALSSEGGGHGGGGHGGAEEARGGHGGGGGGHSEASEVRGLSVSSGGLTLALPTTEFERGRPSKLRFQVLDESGAPVRDFEVEHDRRLHLIVARRDLTEFQHLHPKMAPDGTWSVPLTLREAGSYRVFADFKRDGRNETLATDVAVDGPLDSKPLPPAATTAGARGGYDVRVEGSTARAGDETELRFMARRAGKAVTVQPYLGARGHLVALREGDLAYLHVHPTDEAAAGRSVTFATTFPSAGRYRLFLQFKHRGRVHTAAFTQEVTR